MTGCERNEKHESIGFDHITPFRTYICCLSMREKSIDTRTDLLHEAGNPTDVDHLRFALYGNDEIL